MKSLTRIQANTDSLLGHGFQQEADLDAHLQGQKWSSSLLSLAPQNQSIRKAKEELPRKTSCAGSAGLRGCAPQVSVNCVATA